MPQLPIYLDYNATTPCDQRVMDAMLPYFTGKFGNAASRNHHFGWEANEAVKEARSTIAKAIQADPQEIVFTSGATESINLAIKGVFERYHAKGNHIITCQTEHNAVLDTCRQLEKKGATVTYLPVNAQGQIDIHELESLITDQTILIALMYANNETGVIFPVKDVSDIARKHNVLFFTDATQAMGKHKIDINEDGIDLMAFSAHKLYGPKGVGALYIRRKNPRVSITAQMDGGGHERGNRSGTLNVPGIVGLAKAIELFEGEREKESSRLAVLRDKLEQGLLEIDGTNINGDDQHRLSHVSNISFNLEDGEALFRGLVKTIALSSGSACTSESPEPSHVLTAMGLNKSQAKSSLRFSLGRFTTEEEIDYTIRQVKQVVKEIGQRPQQETNSTKNNKFAE